MHRRREPRTEVHTDVKDRFFEEKPASSFQEEFNSRLRRSGMEKGGVRVSQITEDQRDLIPVYDPDHPDANEEGYVMMPNVDLVKETVDGMAATRSYERRILQRLMRSK